MLGATTNYSCVTYSEIPVYHACHALSSFGSILSSLKLGAEEFVTWVWVPQQVLHIIPLSLRLREINFLPHTA